MIKPETKSGYRIVKEFLKQVKNGEAILITKKELEDFLDEMMNKILVANKCLYQDRTQLRKKLKKAGIEV